MKRLLFSLAAICSLAACGAMTGKAPPSTASTGSSVTMAPGVLNATVIDDQAVKFAFEALDTAAYAIDLAVAVKVVVPGSPKALQIRAYLLDAQKWVNAASVAQKAGSAKTYAETFAKATEALGILNRTIK